MMIRLIDYHRIVSIFIPLPEECILLGLRELQLQMQRVNDRQQPDSINHTILNQLHQYLIQKPDHVNLGKMYRKFNQSLPQLKSSKKLKRSTPLLCPIIFSPQSTFMILWQIVNILIIYLYFLQIPIILAFQNHRTLDTNDRIFQVFNIITILLFLCGIFIKMNTSFYEDGLLKEDPSEIRKNYFKNTFFIDIISILAILIYELLETSKYFDDPNLKLFVVLFFLKVFEIVKIENTMNRSFDLNRRTKAIFKLLLLLMKIFLICNIVACSGFFISDSLRSSQVFQYQDGKDCFEECYWVAYVNFAGVPLCNYTDNFEIQYVYSLYWASTTMISIGYGDITPKNPIEVGFTIVIQFLSCLLFGYSINQIWSIIQELNLKTSKIHFKLNLINLYMRDKDIGGELTSKVNAYLNNYYYSKNLRERDIQNEIISQLTPVLRKQLYYQSYSIILKHKYFAKTDINFKENVCSFVKEIGYYQDQSIFMDINKPPCLYYIKKGELVYETGGKSHTLIKKLYNSDLFGIYQTFTQLPFKSEMRATQYSLVFCLSLQDFKSNIKNFQVDFQRYYQTKQEVLLYNNGGLIGYKCQFCNSPQHRTENCLDNELRLLIKQVNSHATNGENQRKYYHRREFKINHREKYQKIKKHSSIKISKLSQYTNVRKNSTQEFQDLKKSKNVAKNHKIRAQNMKIIEKIRKLYSPSDMESSSSRSEESLYEMRYQQINIDVITDYEQYYPHYNHKEFTNKESSRRRLMRSIAQ